MSGSAAIIQADCQSCVQLPLNNSPDTTSMENRGVHCEASKSREDNGKWGISKNYPRPIIRVPTMRQYEQYAG